MRRAIAAAVGLAVLASPAAAFELFSSVGIAYQSVRLWHDASGGVPALGNPTSVLDYTGMYAPYLTLGARGALGTWDAEASVRLEGLGSGTFEDRDYFAGQILFSETYSSARFNVGLDAELKLLPDMAYGLAGGGTVRPLFTIDAEAQSFSAYGVRCGAVCLGGPVPANVEVIAHQLYGASAGAGAEASLPVGAAGEISLAGVASLGVLFANDSHFLRADLGPVPNITSRYAVLGLDAEARYTHALSDALSGSVSLAAGTDIGWGTSTFGPGTATPMTFPGGFQRVRLGVGLGLEGRF